MGERKIIQIATAGDRLFALCNDGSLWLFPFGDAGGEFTRGMWCRIKDIPTIEETRLFPTRRWVRGWYRETNKGLRDITIGLKRPD